MVVFESLSGKVRYEELPSDASVYQAVVKRSLPREPQHTGTEFYDILCHICVLCWNFGMLIRSLMDRVVVLLLFHKQEQFRKLKEDTSIDGRKRMRLSLRTIIHESIFYVPWKMLHARIKYTVSIN